MQRLQFQREVPPKESPYWILVRERARRLGTDGCSGPAKLTQWYIDACYEHDIHYRTHAWINGDPITQEEADARLRAVVQSRSWFGSWSPLAAWRYHALRNFGQRSWEEGPDAARRSR